MRPSHVLTLALLLALITAPFPAGAVDLNPGDIVVVDSNYLDEQGNFGALIKIDPATGAKEIISKGAPLGNDVHIALDANGNIVATNNGNPGEPLQGVFKIDPATGAKTLVAHINEGVLVSNPTDILVVPSAPQQAFVPSLSTPGTLLGMVLLGFVAIYWHHRRRVLPGLW